jgi:hypothetical protein
MLATPNHLPSAHLGIAVECPNNSSGNSCRYAVRREIMNDHGAGPDYRVPSNADALHDD